MKQVFHGDLTYKQLMQIDFTLLLLFLLNNLIQVKNVICRSSDDDPPMSIDSPICPPRVLHLKEYFFR